MNEDEQFPTGGALDLYASATEADDRTDQSLIGRELGDYRVTGLIARGGMGRIFRAERVDGSFEREVAIKISPGSSLSSELRDRFLREQAILASLNHPNICQLFDAGVTEEGWPYLVMEMVAGQAVDEYCREQQLGPREVSSLMTKIVDATAFAHARLVVHRDLKPSNVMVTEEGNPKLLDFGIAKLLEADAEQTQARPMTPRYASPEQLLGREVTIASDIYQLGALLAELLLGQPLQTDESIETAIERAASGRALAIPARSGSTIPRELKVIAEQCLRVDPGGRYADANGLKRDLECFLDGRPVSAVGLTPGYRLRKFFQRNSTPIAGSVGAGLAIAAGIQTVVWLGASNPCGDPSGRLAGIWDAGTRASVSQSFLDSGFTYAPTLANRVVGVLDGYAADWRAMHVKACEANRVLGTQSDDLFDKRMMCLDDRLTVLGAVTRRFSAADIATLENAPKALESLGSLERCANLEQLSSTVGPPPPETEEAVAELKQQAADIQTDLSTNHFADATAKIEGLRNSAVATAYAPLIAEAEYLAGQVLAGQSEGAAREAFESAMSHAAAARDDYLLAESWIEYVHALVENFSDENADSYLLGAQMAVARAGNDNALRMRLLNLEGGLAYRRGNFPLARDRFAGALAVAEEAGLARSSMLRLNLAAVYREIGEFERSRDLAQQAFDTLSAQAGPDSPLAMRAIESLALVHQKLGDHETSVDYARQVIDAYAVNLGPRHEKVADAKRNLAWSLKEMGDLQEAVVLMQEALDILQGLESPSDWGIASLNNDLGDLLMYLNDFEASEKHLDASLAIWGRDPDSVWAEFPLTNLGFLYNRTDRYPMALDSCSRAVALRQGASNEENPGLAYPLSCIAEALLGLDRAADALGPARKSVELRASNVSYELGWSRFLLARALMLTGQQAAGEEQMTEALQIFAEHPAVDPHMASTVADWRRRGSD